MTGLLSSIFNVLRSSHSQFEQIKKSKEFKLTTKYNKK